MHLILFYFTICTVAIVDKGAKNVSRKLEVDLSFPDKHLKNQKQELLHRKQKSQLLNKHHFFLVNDESLDEKRPFEMPIKGKTFKIFQPLHDMDDNKKT